MGSTSSLAVDRKEIKGIDMMKRTAAILVFGIALIVGSAYASDIEKGFDAYENGDYAEAVKWFRLSAEQGDAKAQFNLAVMYANGQGVIQDDVYAHMWWNIAAANSDSEARKK